MRKFVSLFAVCAMLCMSASLALAEKEAAKQVTLKGTAECAKCELHKTEKCQAALKVTEDGKDTIYYIKGPEAKTIHKEICQAPKENVEVTGVVSEKDGQKWITTSAPAK